MRPVRSALPPLVLALAAVAVQGGWASLRESQTWDEALAVAAGYLHVETGDFELYYDRDAHGLTRRATPRHSRAVR